MQNTKLSNLGRQNGLFKGAYMKTALSDRLMVLILCGISFLGTAIIASADVRYEGVVTMLWPGHVASEDNVGMGELVDGKLTNITQPYLTYFPAPDQEAPVPVVIVSPGGGYNHIGGTTGRSRIPEWLNERGISAFVLHYRLPRKRFRAYPDIQRAIRIVRSRAAEWNIDPERIGVMGSSAGGHLSARASTGYDSPSYEAVDELDGASCKPDFTVLLCPAYMNDGEALDEDFTVTADLSPTLIVTCKDDGFIVGSEIYAAALEEAGAFVRTHFYEKGGHGISIQGEDYPLSTWPDFFLKWLRHIGIIDGIAVSGNRNLIADGDTTPVVDDGTAFGKIPVGGEGVNVFTITNTGPVTLDLADVVVGGASDFTVTAQPSVSQIAPEGQITFELSFAPAAHDSAVISTVSIANNDPEQGVYNNTVGGNDVDQNPYTFTVGGQSPAEFVTEHSTPTKWLYDKGLVDGDYDAAALSDTDQDGMLAWEEYVTGTDPTDGGSVFAVSTVLEGGQWGLEIPASSKPDTPVSIYRSTNLEKWDFVTDYIRTNPTGTNIWIDEGASSSWPNVYYKISVSTD
jgi:acetyl esterase/lipase